MSTPAALSKLKVAELRDKLEAQGLSTEGTKPILLARLRESLGDSLVKTPVKGVETPSKVDTPSRRSKRLSESFAPDKPITPLKKVKNVDTERPTTPVRRSRRLSNASVDNDVTGMKEVSDTIVETIEEKEEEAEPVSKAASKSNKKEAKVVENKKTDAREDSIIVEEEKTPTNEAKTSPQVASEPEPKPITEPDVPMIENIKIPAESKLDDNKKEETKTIDKENLPIPVLLEKIFSSKQIPRQKPKSGRFWKGERGQFRQIKRDRGQRLTFEQRLKMKEEKMRNREVANMLIERKNQAKEELRKKIEENKAKKLENERKTEQYQVIKNPAKLKRMKKKQLRMLEKRDILAKKQQ